MYLFLFFFFSIRLCFTKSAIMKPPNKVNQVRKCVKESYNSLEEINVGKVIWLLSSNRPSEGHCKENIFINYSIAL